MGSVLDEICDLLQTHPNRDKVVALFSYVLKLWGANSGNKALLTASAKLTVTRSTLRMFDTPAAFKAFLSYGLGTHEGPFWGTLGALGCLSTLTMYNIEKLLFLLDAGVLKFSEKDEFRTRTAHKLFWTLMSTIGFIRSLRALHSAAQEARQGRRRCAPARLLQATMTSGKLALDAAHAASYLPAAWHAPRLAPSAQAALACCSATLALVMHYHGKRLS